MKQILWIFIMKLVILLLSVGIICHGFQLPKPTVFRFSQSKDTFLKTSLTMRFVPLTAMRWQIPSTKVQLVLAAHVVVIAAALSLLRFLLGHLIKFVQETIKTNRVPTKDRNTLEVYERRKAEESEKARLAAWKKRQEAEIVELRIRLQQLDEMPTTTFNVCVPNAAKKRELAVIADRKRQQAMILARPMDGINAAKRQELEVIAQRKLQQDMMARDHLSITREEEAEKNRKLTSMMSTAERDAKRTTESALASIKVKVAEVVEQRLESEEQEEEVRYAQEWVAAMTDNTAETAEKELQAQGESTSLEQKQPQPVQIVIEEEKKLKTNEENVRKQREREQQQIEQQFRQARILEEQRAFEQYRQARLDETKKQQEKAVFRREMARKKLEQAEDEQEKQQKTEESTRVEEMEMPSLLPSSLITSTPSLTPPVEAEVDIVSFRPASSSSSISSSTSLAILSPEERAKMELSAAIVTLTAIGLKFGGPLGAVAFASAAKVYGEQGSAQGSFVRGLGKFAVGSLEVAQSVNLKFGVGQAIDNAVLTLIQNSVEAVSQEADKDTVMLNEIRITQEYDRIKNIAARSVNISQGLMEDSIQLLDRVVENVKKVE